MYAEIERLHGDAPWGAVLDAGTGRSSLAWLQQLQTERWTAVTGAQGMADGLQPLLADKRPQDAVLVGNWMDPGLLEGECYDVVLADYLLGAIDGFAPYWQDRLFERLRPLVGRRLYVVGLEPYVPYFPTDTAGRLVCEIGRLRDACLLLAGERPYREYPADWVLRHLALSGYRVLDLKHYPIRYGERFINGQLDMCVQRLNGLRDRAVAVAMQAHVAALRARALAEAQRLNGLRHGSDYIIVAEPA